MINLDQIKEREKIFDEYRQNTAEINKATDRLMTIKAKIDQESQEIRQLNQKKTYLKTLIDIMITNNCDPVEAKLKYNEELDASKLNVKEPGEYITVSTGYAVDTRVNPIFSGEPYV